MVMVFGSPATKSLNVVSPVACVLVAVRVPTDGADQVAQGSGQRREADIQKVARQLLRERLASLRV